MKVGTVVLMALIAMPLPSFAQAFKCTTPTGAKVFSDNPCTAGAKTERVQANEYISPERQRQAQEVHARNAEQVRGIDAANEAYRAALKQQNERIQQADAIDQGRGRAKENADSCVSRIEGISGLSQRQKASAITQCHGAPQREEERPSPIARPAPSTITSCDSGGCWDNVGNRYNGGGNTLFRPDGKACQKIGGMLQCN
mgnify:CR=1 FL=1